MVIAGAVPTLTFSNTQLFSLCEFLHNNDDDNSVTETDYTESLGPMNASAIDFISELCRRLTSVSGDLRESAYLFQRLSLSIQRYNAIAFTGSFLRPDGTD